MSPINLLRIRGIDDNNLLDAYVTAIPKLSMTDHESILPFIKRIYEDNDLLSRLIDALTEKQRQKLRFTIHDLKPKIFQIFYNSIQDPRKNPDAKKAYLGKFQLLYDLQQREADAMSAIPWLNQIANESDTEQPMKSDDIQGTNAIEKALREYARHVAETIQREVDESK